jgi:hypothetical protein
MAARTMLIVIGITVVFGAALVTAAASATDSSRAGAAQPGRAGVGSATSKAATTKVARARTETKRAGSRDQIYVAPFAQHPITTRLYIYAPGPIGSGAVSGATGDSCETSGSDCTDEELCEFWGMNCPDGGISSLPSGARVAGASDQGAAIR